MEWLEAMLLTKVAVFALVLARIGALVATAPLYKLETVPVTVRGLLAVTLSMLVMPLYAHLSYTSPWNLLAFGSLMLNEVLIGSLLGLGMRILLGGVEITGQIIAHMSGMSLAEISSPEFDAGASVFTQIYHYTTMAVFVALGGHRLVMQALLDTFQWAPPGHATYGDSFAEVMVNILQQSFELGIRAAAPIMIAMFLTTLLLGLISRTLPQINILAVGFGLNAFLTIGAVLFTLGGAAWLFQDPIVATLEQLQSTVVPLSAEAGP